MKKLEEKEYEKLASISGVSVSDIQKLAALEVFHAPSVIKQLIKFDYKRIKQGSRYTVKQVTSAIAQEYHISRSSVHTIIYSKKRSISYCNKCGKITRKSELKRNDGLCDLCVINSIKV